MIANSPEQCSETVQCMNRNACYRSSQNPWRRGSDKSGIQCLGRKAGYAWMDLGPGLDPRVEEPGTACRPALLPPVAAARRPAAGGKGPGNLRASRAETAAALFLSPDTIYNVMSARAAEKHQSARPAAATASQRLRFPGDHNEQAAVLCARVLGHLH